MTLTVTKTDAGTGTVTSDLPWVNYGEECAGVYSLDDVVILSAIGSLTYDSTTQTAYDNAGDGNTVKVHTGTFAEELSMDINKSIALQGGSHEAVSEKIYRFLFGQNKRGYIAVTP